MMKASRKNFIILGVSGLVALIALIAMIAISALLKQKTYDTPVSANSTAAIEKVVKASPALASSVSATTVNAPVAETAAPSAVATRPPNPQDEAPQAVLDWSTDLGRGMLGAFREPAQADKMFAFLRSCAEDKSLGLTYRAVCAGNAKRLSDRFPEKYSQNYNGFQRGLPERIQKFLAEANTNF